MLNHYDIIVIGGGHAGVEAASAAARLGASTALVTMARDAIGRMSCNPAIGGLGKGQMVREVDALGGIMGLAIDRGGIHFRMLNRSKGPAVWAPRAQADRKLYAAAVLELVEAVPNLDIIEGVVEEILTTEISAANAPGNRVSGVVLADGRRLRGSAVVVTTGTFMRGLMHCGEAQTEGGRFGEPAAIGISACLEGLGFTLARLKTGTPPRVHRDSLDYKRFERQDGESEPTPFSFLNTTIRREQVPCWITHTNTETHDLIRANLHRAPMYSGQIDSTGPRYCPSIEDKIVRFADKSRHQLFLEPEGYDCDWVYCNGVSTSLPRDVQDAFLRTISGLERVRIVQYGYAVEYDFVPTHQTRLSLEAKRVSGLYFAGQINGTSGYEEAAGQGLLAGANAALQLRGDEPLIIGRDQGYLGVMIDDIITKPPSEPYRMFTSRAEYRLALRSDNADERLTPLAHRVGLVDHHRWSLFEQKQRYVADMRNLVARTPHDGRLLSEVMKQPQITLEHIIEVLKTAGHTDLPRDALQHVLIDARYAGYLIRQERQIERFRKMESTKIPPQADYGTMAELRVEAREKLAAVGPTTLGQAGRIEGISPSDVLALSVYLAGRKHK